MGASDFFGGILIYTACGLVFALPAVNCVIVGNVALFHTTVMSTTKDLLLHPPYSPYLGITTNMAYYGSIVSIVWNYGFFFIGAVAAGCSSAEFKIYIGFIIVLGEIAQLAMNLYLAIMTRHVLPPSVKVAKCSYYAKYWNHSPEYPTLFQVLSRADSLRKERDDIFYCKLLIHNWRYEGAAVALGFLRLAVMLFVVGVFIVDSTTRPSRIRPIIRFVNRWIIKFNVAHFSRTDKDKLHSPSDLESGVQHPTDAHPNGTNNSNESELASRQPQLQSQSESESQSQSASDCQTNSHAQSDPKSERSLRLLDDLRSNRASLSESLHYIEALNLLLTQPLRPSDYESRLGPLTCEKGKKSSCYICRNQICPPCSETVEGLPQETSIYSHINQCKPYCSSCFRSKFCKTTNSRYPWGINSNRTTSRAKDPTWNKPKTCSCARDAGHSVLSEPARTRHKVCKNCKKRNLAVNLESIRQREKGELRHLELQELFCIECTRRIGGGVRWWGCAKCEGECADPVHLGWVLR